VKSFSSAQDDLVAALHSGEVDLALGVDADLPHNIVARTLGQDQLVAMLPAQHALAARTSLSWTELRGERLAMFARGSTYDFALTQLRQRGIGIEQVNLLAYSESLYSLVRSGLAIGVIFRLYTHSLRGDPALAVRPLRTPAVRRGIALMAHRHALALSPLVARCRSHLLSALDDAFAP
jgi:DNA-binding transcriptional LysR family regulator